MDTVLRLSLEEWICALLDGGADHVMILSVDGRLVVAPFDRHSVCGRPHTVIRRPGEVLDVEIAKPMIIGLDEVRS